MYANKRNPWANRKPVVGTGKVEGIYIQSGMRRRNWRRRRRATSRDAPLPTVFLCCLLHRNEEGILNSSGRVYIVLDTFRLFKKKKLISKLKMKITSKLACLSLEIFISE